MATGNPNFEIAPNAPRGGWSSANLPVDVYTMLGIAFVILLVFLGGVLWYWRKLKQETSPES